MKTETALLYGLGAFVAYKLFIAPKSTVIPTQAPPVYTNTTNTGSPNNTTTVLGSGLLLLGNTLKNILNPNPAPPIVINTADPGPVENDQPVDITQDLNNAGFAYNPGNSLNLMSGTNPALQDEEY